MLGVASKAGMTDGSIMLDREQCAVYLQPRHTEGSLSKGSDDGGNLWGRCNATYNHHNATPRGIIPPAPRYCIR